MKMYFEGQINLIAKSVANKDTIESHSDANIGVNEITNWLITNQPKQFMREKPVQSYVMWKFNVLIHP
jgi:hypothetical protein